VKSKYPGSQQVVGGLGGDFKFTDSAARVNHGASFPTGAYAKKQTQAKSAKQTKKSGGKRRRRRR